MRAVVLFFPSPLFFAKRIRVFEKKRNPGTFVLFGAIERLGGIEVRRFLVDILTLVAVALGQVFRF